MYHLLFSQEQRDAYEEGAIAGFRFTLPYSDDIWPGHYPHCNELREAMVQTDQWEYNTPVGRLFSAYKAGFDAALQEKNMRAFRGFAEYSAPRNRVLA